MEESIALDVQPTESNPISPARESDALVANIQLSDAESAPESPRTQPGLLISKNPNVLRSAKLVVAVVFALLIGAALGYMWPRSAPSVSPDPHGDGSGDTDPISENPKTSTISNDTETFHPSESPTHTPTKMPTWKSTEQPTYQPTQQPSQSPSQHPSQLPTPPPTQQPTEYISPTLFPEFALNESIIASVVGIARDHVQQVLPNLRNITYLADAYSKAYMTTILTTAEILEDGSVFVKTGDIPDMWLRDSSAQIRPYIDLAVDHRDMQLFIEGLIVKQAQMLLMDPYANSYRPIPVWNNHEILGRGGVVATRNYEVDSGCYMVWLAYRYWQKTQKTTQFNDIFLLAVKRMVSTFKTEQRHADSTYSYSELPNHGVGSPVSYTGMTWTGYRPSDDEPMYGYHLPDNIMAVVTLQRATEIIREVYPPTEQETIDIMAQLSGEIEAGIRSWGLTPEGNLAYEVDGRNNQNLMDDANVPSLLSIPYLLRDSQFETSFDNMQDPQTDNEFARFLFDAYSQTREFVLSSSNPYYFSGSSARGIGSPHTPVNYVWPMSLIIQGLASQQESEKLDLLEVLLTTSESQKQTSTYKRAPQTSQFHESFSVSSPNSFTRPHFAWVDSLFVEWVEQDFVGD